MPFIHTGGHQPEFKINKDYIVHHHPGKPRTPKAARTFKEPVTKLQPAKSVRAALETIREYWIPGRASDPIATDSGAVKRIRRDLKRLDRRLRIAWNRQERMWGIWMVAPQIKTEWCKGWKLLFSVKPGKLDNRVMWKLYQCDSEQFGGAKKMYDAFVAQLAVDAAKVTADLSDQNRTWASEYFDHTRPMITTIPGKAGWTNGRKFQKHR